MLDKQSIKEMALNSVIDLKYFIERRESEIARRREEARQRMKEFTEENLDSFIDTEKRIIFECATNLEYSLSIEEQIVLASLLIKNLRRIHVQTRDLALLLLLSPHKKKYIETMIEHCAAMHVSNYFFSIDPDLKDLPEDDDEAINEITRRINEMSDIDNFEELEQENEKMQEARLALRDEIIQEIVEELMNQKK